MKKWERDVAPCDPNFSTLQAILYVWSVFLEHSLHPGLSRALLLPVLPTPLAPVDLHFAGELHVLYVGITYYSYDFAATHTDCLTASVG